MKDSTTSVREPVALSGGMSGCPNCVCEGCDWDEDLDLELGVQVVRVVDRYLRKVEKGGPWTDFEALVPESARRPS